MKWIINNILTTILLSLRFDEDYVCRKLKQSCWSLCRVYPKTTLNVDCHRIKIGYKDFGFCPNKKIQKLSWNFQILINIHKKGFFMITFAFKAIQWPVSSFERCKSILFLVPKLNAIFKINQKRFNKHFPLFH